MPRTALGLLNFLLLQWFFVRLAHVVHVDVETDAMKGEGFEIRTLPSWKLLWGVVPLTGWWSDFRYVGRR